MDMDLNKIFIDTGIYKSKKIDEGIFVAQAIEGNNIGKLTFYKPIEDNRYEKTNLTYFLNFFEEGDIKQLFICRDNYDMVGRIGVNYSQHNDIIERN